MMVTMCVLTEFVQVILIIIIIIIIIIVFCLIIIGSVCSLHGVESCFCTDNDQVLVTDDDQVNNFKYYYYYYSYVMCVVCLMKESVNQHSLDQVCMPPL